MYQITVTNQFKRDYKVCLKIIDVSMSAGLADD